MATKPSISPFRRGASALTTEAGKLIRDSALNAAHQALVVALQTVQAADRKLRGTGTTRRKSTRTARPTTKRKATPAIRKGSRAVATTPRTTKSPARPARRVAR